LRAMAIRIKKMMPALLALTAVSFFLATPFAATDAAARESAADDDQPGRYHPERSGLLVIAAGLDSTRFQWAPVGEVGDRALVWPGGSLTLAAGIEPGSFGPSDLTIPYDLSLTGVSDGRRLIFATGRYPIDQTLLLTDGRFQLTVHRGELEIVPGRILYTDEVARDKRGPYMMLAGVLLLTAVLLARVRAKLRNS